jgi:hypothetical protein
MNKVEKVKQKIRLDKTSEYVSLARESADAIEGIMNSAQSQDEKYLAIWEHFVSINICNDSELDKVGSLSLVA